MANQINWGEMYCEMQANEAWGDEQWNTFTILDESAPTCWSIIPITPFTADMISYFGGNLTSDTIQFTADITQL